MSFEHTLHNAASAPETSATGAIWLHNGERGILTIVKSNTATVLVKAGGDKNNLDTIETDASEGSLIFTGPTFIDTEITAVNGTCSVTLKG